MVKFMLYVHYYINTMQSINLIKCKYEYNIQSTFTACLIVTNTTKYGMTDEQMIESCTCV